MHNVIQNTDHEDVENFAVCSRYLFNLIKEEREKIQQKYYVIRCGTTWEDGVELFQPLPLIQEIVSCPRIASFPTKMFIRDCNTEGLESQIEEEYELVSPQDKIGIRKLLWQSPYLEQGERDDWYKGILTGRLEPAIALLISLLPNLHSIELFDHDAGTSYNGH